MQESRKSGRRPNDVDDMAGQTTTDYGTTATPRYRSRDRMDEPGITDQAKQQASGMADQAQEQAGKLVDNAQQQAMSQADSQKERLARGIADVADAVGQVGQQLRQNDQDRVAHYADSAAGELHHISGYLRQQQIGQIVDDAQELVRQRPALVLGGAFAIGMLGARFLKSTAPSRSPQMSPSRYGDYRRERYPAAPANYRASMTPPLSAERDSLAETDPSLTAEAHHATK